MSQRLFCPACESELMQIEGADCCELGGTEFCQWDGSERPLTEREYLERESQRVKDAIAAGRTKLLAIRVRLNQL